MSLSLSSVAEALQANKLSVSQAATQQLLHYLTLLQAWNKVFNLTSIHHTRDMIYLHLIDSLLIQPYVPGTHCLDVGSGAGLPGLPLAILHPEQTWVLLDKNNKKTRFMTQVVAELGLKNVSVVQHRCEDFQAVNLFDHIVARAFGSLTLFTQATAHLLAPTGTWVAMKGKYPHDELAMLPKSFIVQNIAHLDITGIQAERHIVCLRANNH